MRISRRQRVKRVKVDRELVRNQRTLEAMGVDIHVQGEPWDQQFGEKRDQYEAFKLFRDMGSARTLKAVSATTGSKEETVQRWCRNWSWHNRVRAYEMNLDKIEQAEHEREVRIMGRRQAQLGVKIQMLGEKRLDTFIATPELQSTISAMEAAKLVEIGSKVERAAAGEKDKGTGNITFNIGMGALPQWAPPAARAALPPALLEATLIDGGASGN